MDNSRVLCCLFAGKDVFQWLLTQYGHLRVADMEAIKMNHCAYSELLPLMKHPFTLAADHSISFQQFSAFWESDAAFLYRQANHKIIGSLLQDFSRVAKGHYLDLKFLPVWLDALVYLPEAARALMQKVVS